ncbi:MAG: lipocalin-like domain-containing protein [Bacteroidales bacterium]
MNSVIRKGALLVILFGASLFQNVSAQGILDVLNKGNIKETIKNAVENVAGDYLKFSIQGEWIYKEASIDLVSSNKQANIGSQVLGKTLDNKLNEQLSRIGFKPDMMRITFEQDSTFQIRTEARTVTGSYSYDKNSNELTLIMAKMVPLRIQVKVLPSNVEFLFEANGLLNLGKTIGGTLQIRALETLKLLLSNYQNMNIAMKYQAADGRKLLPE